MYTVPIQAYIHVDRLFSTISHLLSTVREDTLSYLVGSITQQSNGMPCKRNLVNVGDIGKGKMG